MRFNPINPQISTTIDSKKISTANPSISTEQFKNEKIKPVFRKVPLKFISKN